MPPREKNSKYEGRTLLSPLRLFPPNHFTARKSLLLQRGKMCVCLNYSTSNPIFRIRSETPSLHLFRLPKMQQPAAEAEVDSILHPPLLQPPPPSPFPHTECSFDAKRRREGGRIQETFSDPCNATERRGERYREFLRAKLPRNLTKLFLRSGKRQFPILSSRKSCFPPLFLRGGEIFVRRPFRKKFVTQLEIDGKNVKI